MTPAHRLTLRLLSLVSVASIACGGRTGDDAREVSFVDGASGASGGGAAGKSGAGTGGAGGASAGAGGSSAGAGGSAGAAGMVACDTTKPFPMPTNGMQCAEVPGEGCEIRCLAEGLAEGGLCPSITSPEVVALTAIAANPCQIKATVGGPHCEAGWQAFAMSKLACCYTVSYEFCGVGRPLLVGGHLSSATLAGRADWG